MSSEHYFFSLPTGRQIQLHLSPEHLIHPHFIPPLFLDSAQDTPALGPEQKYTIHLLAHAHPPQPGIRVYQFESSILISRQDRSFFVTLNESRYEIKQRYLEIAISIAVSIILVEEKILSLHAASIVLENQGFVFVGASGSGKTTLAQIAHAQGLRVLSDELSAIMPKKPNDAYVIMPGPHWGSCFFNPQHGEHSRWMNSAVALKALFFLEKKSQQGTTFSDISQSDAAVLLIRSFFSARFVHQLPSEQKGQVFFMLCQLARTFHSYSLNIDLKDDVLVRLRQKNLEPITNNSLTYEDFNSIGYLISTLSDNALLFRLRDFSVFKLDHHSARLIKKRIQEQGQNSANYPRQAQNQMQNSSEQLWMEIK